MQHFHISKKRVKSCREVSKITVKFITLGCKTNLYESDAMAELFKNSGYERVYGTAPADVYVINTCTVTAVGAQKSRQHIRRAKRENPAATVAVTGCLVQTEADKIKRETGADILVGNNRRGDIVRLVEAAMNGKKSDAVDNILAVHEYEELGAVRTQNRVRANLKIEDGCNNFCTYCIIPFARGPVRSRKMENIIKEAEILGESGYGELVLTGIHIDSYGSDLKDGSSLADVIEKIHDIDGIRRIRLGSLEPVAITEGFAVRMKKLEKLCPQFHMSLQSGCAETLKRMNRRYTPEDYRRAVKLLRESFADAAITTDLMVGFPGETDEEFEESYSFCREIGFSQMHIFPYSVREGTAAAKFKNQVPESVKHDRVKVMLGLAADMKKEFCSKYIGGTMTVLAEQKKKGGIHSTAANYVDVLIQDGQAEPGQTVNVKIEGFDGEYLTGKKLN